MSLTSVILNTVSWEASSCAGEGADGLLEMKMRLNNLEPRMRRSALGWFCYKCMKERLEGKQKHRLEEEGLDGCSTVCFHLTSGISQTVLTILSKSSVELSRPALSVLLMTFSVMPLF